MSQVAQFKATVLLMPNGSDRVTTAAPTQKLETDKKVRSGLACFIGMARWVVLFVLTAQRFSACIM